MFPNVRLIIAAIAASIVGISCGLGVFAAFRVNHDPFVRLPNSAPPLQLVFSNAAPAPVTDAAAPFGVRFPPNAPQLNAPQLNAPQSGVAAPPAEPVRAEPNATAPTPAPDAQDAAAKKDSTAAIEQAAPQSAPADAAVQDSVQDSKSTTADEARPHRKPVPRKEATAGAKTPAKIARAAAKRPPRLAAKPRRWRTARASVALPSADQSSAYAQPAYQFTTPAQRQSAKRRRSASQ